MICYRIRNSRKQCYKNNALPRFTVSIYKRECLEKSLGKRLDDIFDDQWLKYHGYSLRDWNLILYKQVHCKNDKKYVDYIVVRNTSGNIFRLGA